MKFEIAIISPKGIYLEDKIDSLTICLTSGYRTILAEHAALIGALDYAPMHIIKDGRTTYYAVHGGAINIDNNHKVTLIVNSIEMKDDIDVERAKAAKERAEKRLSNKNNDINIDVKRAELALARASARIKTFEK